MGTTISIINEAGSEQSKADKLERDSHPLQWTLERYRNYCYEQYGGLKRFGGKEEGYEEHEKLMNEW